MTQKWSRETLATVTWWNSEERRLAVEAAKLETNARLRPWYWSCVISGFAGVIVGPNFERAYAAYTVAIVAGVVLFARMFIEMRRFTARISEIDSEGLKRPRPW